MITPSTSLTLSLRLPTTLDPAIAAQHLKALLERDPPYACEASFRAAMVSSGWHSRALAPWREAVLERASMASFGQPLALIGGGGGIPFLAMLGELFSAAQFIVTGVLGPQSNAHGLNEFPHVPSARRVTETVAHVLLDAGKRPARPQPN